MQGSVSVIWGLLRMGVPSFVMWQPPSLLYSRGIQNRQQWNHHQTQTNRGLETKRTHFAAIQFELIVKTFLLSLYFLYVGRRWIVQFLSFNGQRNQDVSLPRTCTTLCSSNSDTLLSESNNIATYYIMKILFVKKHLLSFDFFSICFFSRWYFGVLYIIK